ncbi:DNA-protecting protein DprA [Croceicoccus ponticola]|uniref:DNA-protecting protein DprA n=1 Tax=Croceicoccus ponticola TaxID=2217664 RepID=A0A437H1B9_9SPHN|nr:DNA-processing protein DprA [Croceicoccus ponticola]RVQ69425.1 DNA-protecting protein DprA [Croceicoccus ponticola]
MPITQEEAFARIRLLRTANVGPVSFRQLLTRFGTAMAALDALPDLAARGGRRQVAANADTIRAEIAAVRAAGTRYLFHDDPAYPELLRIAPYAPPILTYRGDVALFERPAVAIVGARNASAAALKLARHFADALAASGRLVVSGLARGIDGAAHEGALASGATAAVIAGGIDVAYPPQHAELQERIASEGVLIAEQPPGVEPQARHFPGRNRIIAGLCSGTLVVEAAPRSGSLITARLAGEAGREVMAIPGNPLDGRARGCNQLIREGAILVQTPEDVIELLDGFTGEPRSTFREERDEFEGVEPDQIGSDEPADIEDLLSTAPVPVDEIVRASGDSPAAVQLALLELELAGRLTRHAGGKVSLTG